MLYNILKKMECFALGIVKVDKKGIMHTLFDAKIIVDDLTSYHSFTKAIVDVNSAFSYVASGDYIYKDALNNEQILFIACQNNCVELIEWILFIDHKININVSSRKNFLS